MAREIVSEFEARRVQRMVGDLLARWLRPGERLAIAATEEAGWVSMRWELATDARDRVYLVDVRVDLRKEKLRERAAVDLLYDFFGAQFEAYVRDREPFSGPDWEEVTFEGHTLHLRGQESGERAEVRADALLVADAYVRSRDLAAAAVQTSDGDRVQSGDDPPDPDA